MNFVTVKVVDTFHLESGRTIFVGLVETEIKAIPSCDCEILVDGEIKGVLRTDGEEIPKGGKTMNRAISTSERIELVHYGIGQGSQWGQRATMDKSGLTGRGKLP